MTTARTPLDRRPDVQPPIFPTLRGPVRLTAIRPASDVLPVGPSSFLHSGPPMRADTLPGALRGALIAALLFEDVAADVTAAETLIDRGQVELASCQDHGAAGPLTGVITPNTPVVVAEHHDGVVAYAPLHEGDHGGLRTGMYDARTVERLRWIRDLVAPTLATVVAASVRDGEPLDITAMQASGLRRGDECHNRNISSTLALIGHWAPAIARCDRAGAVATFDYLSSTSQLFISLSAAAAKATADVIDRRGPSGMVTGVGMNGHEFGIRVSGLEGWFTAPSPTGPMVSLDGGDITQSGRGQGDSPIIESIGLGAFSLTAAPALAEAFGITVRASAELVTSLRQIAAVDSPVFQLAADEWRGAPAVIDVRRVADTGVVPSTTLGFMHREPGRGRVGVGIVPMPIEPFLDAARSLP